MDGKSLSSDQSAILAEQQLAHGADQRWSLKAVRPVRDRYQYPSLGHHSARRSRAYLRARGSFLCCARLRPLWRSLSSVTDPHS